MQAIIMAAGRGVRMRPLTDTMPKPLLKVSGKPILERTISQLPDEVTEIIIVVGYLKEQIYAFIKEKFPGRNVKFVVDDEMQGSGYAVYACQDLMHGRFLVLNADDLYLKSDIQKMVKEDLAILCVKLPMTEDYGRFDRFEVDGKQHYKGIVKYQHSEWTNIGVYSLTTEFFKTPLYRGKSGEYFLPHTVGTMSSHYGKKVKVVEAKFWAPIGHPEDIKKAEAALAKEGLS